MLFVGFVFCFFPDRKRLLTGFLRLACFLRLAFLAFGGITIFCKDDHCNDYCLLNNQYHPL